MMGIIQGEETATMTKSQLVERIRAMPVAEQLEVAETILHDLASAARLKERETLRRQMEESAKEALEYYQSDPDVALWGEMDAEPFHE